MRSDQESTSLNEVRTHHSIFLERYQLDLADEDTIEGARARDLFIALKRISKDFSLSFHMTSVQQFAQRLANDLGTIREAGFEVEVHREQRAGHATATYSITCSA